jgi:hypothetical protein
VADEWEDVVDRWAAELDQQGWVTLAEAQAATGVSRSALRSWYRAGQLASRLQDGPHGPQRLVPLDAVVARVARSPRLQRSAPAGAGAATADHRPGGAEGDNHTASALVELLAAQIDRAERRAERAEAALREALVRAAAAEAERDELRRRS